MPIDIFRRYVILETIFWLLLPRLFYYYSHSPRFKLTASAVCGVYVWPLLADRLWGELNVQCPLRDTMLCEGLRRRRRMLRAQRISNDKTPARQTAGRWGDKFCKPIIKPGSDHLLRMHLATQTDAGWDFSEALGIEAFPGNAFSTFDFSASFPTTFDSLGCL